MIFAFDKDDGSLWILEGEGDAQREFEGIHVEEGPVHFYDEHGAFLEPRFSVPNSRGKLLGILRWERSGQYELVPTADARQDSFALALQKANLQPNRWFSSLEQLKSALAQRGIEVEPRSGCGS